jgi:hypothetical protein
MLNLWATQQRFLFLAAALKPSFGGGVKRSRRGVKRRMYRRGVIRMAEEPQAVCSGRDRTGRVPTTCATIARD